MNFQAGSPDPWVDFPGASMKSSAGRAHLRLPATGDDANANELVQQGHDTVDGSSPLPPLLSQGDEAQDRLLIWGTEERPVTPDLQEVQEIHTFQREGFRRPEAEEEEEAEDDGSVRDGRDEGLMSISSSSTASSSSIRLRRNDNDSNRLDRERGRTGGRERGRERREICCSSEELDSCSGEEMERERRRIGGNERRREKMAACRSSEELDSRSGEERGRERGRERREAFRSAEQLDGERERKEGRDGERERERGRDRREAYLSSEELDSRVVEERERGRARGGRERERERGRRGLKECRSETDVFVTSLSAVNMSGSLASVLDPQPLDLRWTRTQTSACQLDHNQNSPPPLHPRPAPPHHQDAPARRQEESRVHDNGAFPTSSSPTSVGGAELKRREVAPPPPRRQQLVRPMCQSETGRGRSLAEPIAAARRTSWHSSPSPSPSPDPQGHRGNGRSSHFTFLPEPTDVSHLYSSSAPGLLPSSSPTSSSTGAPTKGRQPGPMPQREACSVGREVSSNPLSGSTLRTSSQSGHPSTLERRPQSHLTYRRNCSSPNRVSLGQTPPQSPHTTPQGSPRRKPPMYGTSRGGQYGMTGPTQSGYGCPGPGGMPNPSLGIRPPVKTIVSAPSGIPKAPLAPAGARESPPSPKSAPKPKGVRPKIITYIRKSPQIKPQASDGPYQVSSLPSRLTAYAPSSSLHPAQIESSKPGLEGQRGAPVLSASNQLYEKYRQEMQRSRLFPSAGLGTGIRPPTGHTARHTHSHTAPPKLGSHGDSYYGPPIDRRPVPCQTGRTASFGGGSGCEDLVRPKMATPPGCNSGSLLRSARGLRLGLGAVTRTTPGTAKSRGPSQVQRSTLTLTQPVQAVAPATNLISQENSETQRGSLRDQQPHLQPQSQPQPQAHLQPQSQPQPQAHLQPQSQPQPQPHLQPQSQPQPQPQPQSQPELQPHPQPQSPPQVQPHSPPQLQPQAQLQPARSLLPRAGQSGLRVPGFSSTRLPPGRLAAFGFVRSSSVSSVQSGDSTESEPCRPAHRLSGSEEPSVHRASPPAQEQQRGGPCRSTSLQPPSTPALPRRYLPAQPRSSPGVGRKEFPRSSEVTRSLPSSPKRLAVVPPKPQTPAQPAHRPAAAVKASVPPGSPRRIAPFREQQENLQREKEEAQQQEREKEAQEREKEREEQREEVQRLTGLCEQQEAQLNNLRDQLRKTTLGLEAFVISTQYYCLKSESNDEKEKELCEKMEKVSDDAAYHFAQWERLQGEKEALEAGFERELQEMQLLQEEELAAVEEELRKCHSAESDHLRAEHQSEVEELRTQQQEQMEELSINHQAAVQELRDMHNITMATLHEEHARTMRDLRKAHVQQKAFLEEDSEKLRLSMQDQVDTLTFQNHGLRDKARRFEEALKRTTEEQIVDVLAPYRHIEEDLRSLKDVLEMKNQQIHLQEKKIAELGIVAQNNVFLEERVQLLQQHNEDLRARVDKNLSLSRHLSEENANLQDTVERETSEKKRLSRNNEELLWRLQTSPSMSPCSSPLHRSFSSSPAPSSPSPCPATAFFDSPTHCCGCPLPATPTHCSSHAHRAATNQNLSPGLPGTPTHRASGNQNCSPGPATPTHRGSANHCSSPAHLNSLQR